MDPFPLDRHRYPRIRAPLVQRPLGWFTAGIWRRSRVPDRGGLRAYSDDRHSPGEMLQVEVFLPDGASAAVVAEVVRVDELVEGAPARFDVWMRLVNVSADDLSRLAPVLGDR
jgi:hypothetical protein